MTTTTKKELIHLQDLINSVLDKRGIDKEICVSWAYGQPRVELYSGSGDMQSDLSPRLPKPQMYDWLHAFYQGLTFNDTAWRNS